MTQTTLDIGPSEESKNTESPGLISVFLYRWQIDDEYPLYGEMRKVKRIQSCTVIGVATRPPGETICSGGTRNKDEFIEQVEAKAIQWEWLDTEMDT